MLSFRFLNKSSSKIPASLLTMSNFHRKGPNDGNIRHSLPETESALLHIVRTLRNKY